MNFSIKNIAITIFVAGFISAIVCMVLTRDKVVNSEQITRDVTIVSVDYDPPHTYMQAIHNGKFISYIPITYPADYITFIEYNDTQYEIDKQTVYEYAKEHIGEEMEALFTIKYYESGKEEIALEDILIE